MNVGLAAETKSFPLSHFQLILISMKKIFLYSISALLLTGFYACKKQEAKVLPYSTYNVTTSQGQLKIVYASAYLANPTVLLKINGQTVSSLITGRTPFPGGGYNTTGSNYALYLSVPQGTDTITVVRPKVGFDTDSIVLYKTTFNIPDSSAYTLHITDTLVNATVNNTRSLLVKNDRSALDTGMARFRFVNLIPNVATTGGAVDLYLNGILQVSNIAYGQASNTFVVKTGVNAPGVTDPNNIPVPTWTVRPAGAVATSTALATYASANTLLSQRVYTVFSMGYSGATGNRLPYVSFTLDKNN